MIGLGSLVGLGGQAGAGGIPGWDNSSSAESAAGPVTVGGLQFSPGQSTGQLLIVLALAVTLAVAAARLMR